MTVQKWVRTILSPVREVNNPMTHIGSYLDPPSLGLPAYLSQVHMSSRPKPLDLSSSYYRLSFFWGAIPLSSILCHHISAVAIMGYQRKFGSPKFRVTDVYISSQWQLKQRIAKAQGS